MKGNGKRKQLRKELHREVLSDLLDEMRTKRATRDDGASRVDGAPSGARDGLASAQALGLGAIGAAAVLLLADNREKLRPAIVGGFKEFHRFADWLGVSFASVREDLADMSAEASQEYEKELAEHLSHIEKEREVIARLQDLSKRRSQEGR